MLGLADQSVGEGVHDDAGDDAHRSGQRRADEDQVQIAAATALDEIGRDDREDEGDLETFAKGDEEAGAHWPPW